MLNTFRNKVIQFTKSKNEAPVLAAIASGLYPLFHYYNSNFTLVNSWQHLLFFISFFLIIPVILFVSTQFLLKKIKGFQVLKKYIIPILSLWVFAFLIVISTYGFRYKVMLLALFLATILAVTLVRHFKKIIVFQLILAVLVAVKLVPDLYKQITYSSAWMDQPDSIESIQFNKQPNVYVIQPDGYASFSEIQKGYYNFNNHLFENFLEKKGFKLYPNFRSNYYSTLSSNSSMFAMKHHYFNSPKQGSSELFKSREIIVGNNPVVSIFKNNDYKTNLILESSYLLVNRPKIAYDYCNFNLSEVPYLARGFEHKKNVLKNLEFAMNNGASKNFYFIEKILPGHISTYKNGSDGKEIERKDYLDNVEKANRWLEEIIELITTKDSNALIVVVADHAGFVGFEYTREATHKQTDRDLVYSIFSTALAIKWPLPASEYDDKLKTNVNLFRVLLSYLAEDTSYLKDMEEDKSYSVIQQGAPFGVYQAISPNGEVVFKMISE